MNKEAFILFLFLASTFLIISASAIEITYPALGTTPDTSNLEVRSLRYEPYPVSPGEYFTLYVKVENYGSTDATNVTCSLELLYPFSSDTPSELEKNYGRLGGMEQIVIEYDKIRVDSNALDGNNIIKVKCTGDTFKESWRVNEISIKVQTRYPSLNIKSVKTEPAEIIPGQPSLLLITLENTAYSSMRDISLKLDFSTAQFAPYEEIPEKTINRINANETAGAAFKLLALPTADGGIHKVPINITYKDDAGNQFNQSTIITIFVGSLSEIYSTIDSTTISSASSTGTVSIKIVNPGLTDLKFADANLLPSRDYKILSSDRVYIGDIDSDDYQTADFRITAKKGKFIIPINLTYRDTANNIHFQQLNATFTMFSPSELGEKQSSTSGIFIFIVALIIFYFVYRRWKRKNEDKHLDDFFILILKTIWNIIIKILKTLARIFTGKRKIVIQVKRK